MRPIRFNDIVRRTIEMVRREAALLASASTAATIVLAASSCGESSPPQRVFDFTEQLPAAEVRMLSRSIDFGTQEARASFGDGWSHDLNRGNHSYVWGLAERSSLRAFIPEVGDMTLHFRCWPYLNDVDSQTITVTMNGKTLRHLKLKPVPAEYRIEIAAEHLRAGWNDLVFAYSPAQAREGKAELRESVVAWDWLRIEGFPAAAAPFTGPEVGLPSLILPFGSRLDYYVKLPPGSRLHLDGLRPWSESPQTADDGSILQIEVETAVSADVRRLRLAPTQVAGTHPLDVASPQMTRISFQALRGKESANGPSGLEMLGPRILFPRPRDGTGARPRRASAATNVIFYLVDTLRADHLGCYGYAKPTSPNIDRLARAGTLFSNTIAQSSWTRPAVASLLTGLYARTHGVNERKDKLPASLSQRDLPALLRQRGYATAAFVTNSNVGPSFGFSAGFDTWEHFTEQNTDAIHHYSDEVNEKVFAWLENRPENKPFYLYIHTVDPHAPYTPPSPFRERFAPHVPPEIGLQRHHSALKTHKIRNGERFREDVMALYDAEIAFNDVQFGKLLDKLESLGLYESALIVFVSDHGEEFYEHLGWGHGHSLFGEQLKVPLIIKFPDGFGSGKTIRAAARQIDVVPTVLEHLGQASPGDVEGRSLLPQIGADVVEADDLITFSYLKLDGREMDSVIADGYELIHVLANERRPAHFALYDRGADPLEKEDLAEQRQVVAGYLRALLKDHSRRVAAEAEEASLDPTTEERLRALGY